MQQARHIREPFSDIDILDIQDIFLKNGLHYIKVDDLTSGRELVNLFLDSLNYYSNVACLTTSNYPLYSKATNLYNELEQGGYLQSNFQLKIEEFFLEQFYYDFVWVEATRELVRSEWTTACFRQMKHFKLDQLIPILIVSYDKG